jgi:WD40 repeat protein
MAAMFQNICAIPFDHDLFTQAIHSSEPIISVGLSSGHVQTYRLPAGASDDGDGDDTLASENGFGHIETAWKTRRHKGSCRALAFGVDGAQLFSAGTDGIVKVADVANGNVTAKIAIPNDPYVILFYSAVLMLTRSVPTMESMRRPSSTPFRLKRFSSAPIPLRSIFTISAP